MTYGGGNSARILLYARKERHRIQCPATLTPLRREARGGSFACARLGVALANLSLFNMQYMLASGSYLILIPPIGILVKC